MGMGKKLKLFSFFFSLYSFSSLSYFLKNSRFTHSTKGEEVRVFLVPYLDFCAPLYLSVPQSHTVSWLCVEICYSCGPLSKNLLFVVGSQ